ncbi:bacillithiol biosynthesis cysteine-adding enzyme BshC [Halobacillus kuroshimensis]|uniref:bacillithiol biosynthesis cysteine-adding enzyme BshC n=1 Tax=Halobacillus kuroshimensis TaxID=302481 RepID=UPI000411FFEB|nr:bacillithiol biosynthesis cysteine-adding enzyme BshC [Halobacillus kuroshimensis]
MRIDSMNMEPKQTLFRDYKYNYEKIADRFSYSPYDENVWADRLEDLKTKTYQREALSEVLKTMNEKWKVPRETLENIERLKDEESVVVIAGQQAGLLTGPLYSVHKIISVLQLAGQKEKELGRPVIPVFWIAGEDHDFDEINHIMMKQEGRMEKKTIGHVPEVKSSVSELQLDQTEADAWLEDVFRMLPETENTNHFYQLVQDHLHQSDSYTDFFARLIYQLFPHEGLVLIDAHDPEVRRLETPYFTTMIHQNREMAGGVFSVLQKNRQEGYETLLDSEMQDAHLFYHDRGDRILLVRDEEGRFRGKNNEVVLSKEELLQIAEESPEKLSNNVVTRPLMQESLFPVLAFIGGPGEINYWSALKPAFDAADLCMPPVLPRLSFTLVDRKTDRSLRHFQLSVEDVVKNGAAEKKMNWIGAMSTPPVKRLSEQVKDEIARIHTPLREKAAELGGDLGQLADKNLAYLQETVAFLEKRMLHSLEDTYRKELDQFDDIDITLHPAGGLQERMWNILPWVNGYGLSLFQEMNRHHLSFEHDHYVVYL